MYQGGIQVMVEEIETGITSLISCWMIVSDHIELDFTNITWLDWTNSKMIMMMLEKKSMNH